MIFGSLDCLEKEFEESDILLTPHIITPIIPRKEIPNENNFLNNGIYNLGFIGVKRSENSFGFLNWWEERLICNCYDDVSNGIFVDQLLINLLHLYFFKGVNVLKEYGYNCAPWNLHERKNISSSNAGYSMEDNSPLIFYHFSSYNFKHKDKMSKYYFSHNFDNCPALLPIYESYQIKLVANNISLLSTIPCFYVIRRTRMLESEVIPKSKTENLKRLIKLFIPPVLLRFRKN